MSQHDISMEGRQKRYWVRNRQITLVFLLLWFSVTYLTTYFAEQLNQVQILGFPLGFYMAAQGSLLVYVLLVGGYVLLMRWLEKNTVSAIQTSSCRKR